ncbi:MAG: hypothetical protein Q8L51_02195 [Candidatus Amesbacteria bacterium]|nr:hypothetical protein [Candidatus Amesbacteria bacterium]
MKKGQTLVVLLVFIAIAMAIVVAAVSSVINSTTGGSQYEIGQSAYLLAESGLEEAMLRLLRDPAYTGETLTTADGSTTIIVTGTIQKIIISTATVGNSTRKIQVEAEYINNVLTVISWNEI